MEPSVTTDAADAIRILRDGPDAQSPGDVAIALELKRKGYAEVSATMSRRIGRSGIPVFFEWRGRTAQGDAFLAQHRASTTGSSARRWLVYVATGVMVVVIAGLCIRAMTAAF